MTKKHRNLPVTMKCKVGNVKLDESKEVKALVSCFTWIHSTVFHISIVTM